MPLPAALVRRAMAANRTSDLRFLLDRSAQRGLSPSTSSSAQRGHDSNATNWQSSGRTGILAAVGTHVLGVFGRRTVSFILKDNNDLSPASGVRDAASVLSAMHCVEVSSGLLPLSLTTDPRHQVRKWTFDVFEKHRCLRECTKMSRAQHEMMNVSHVALPAAIENRQEAAGPRVSSRS
jgi:hypothetical protein